MTRQTVPLRRTHPLRRFLTLLAALAAVAITLAITGPPDTSALATAAERAGSVGPLVAVPAYALGIVLCVPRTVLSFASGLLFGWLPGFGYAMAGALLGASAGFAVGRLMGREYVDARLAAWSELESGQKGRLGIWVRQKLALADGWLAKRGVMGVWILRTIPIAHYGVTSYACGTSGVRYRHYFIGTLVGSIPGALGYAAVGSSLVDAGSIPLMLGVAAATTLVSLGTAALIRRRTATP
ncbi:hypothetical protein Afil01_05510 [Actinorhabdospora filicis]|uniref:TVP38/TMEM64 family membrane protein n=1 Tax=Actinorhabdospora filicis TaxID=1785913 RepID=A0A9W6SHU8_9ACTN|nr:TVP38/TMEM64 family protein [Actinorhabdospora filicis]GLZ75744.1 hypothetical protein Afil01_05510 [Actinorhabdospora filicis]